MCSLKEFGFRGRHKCGVTLLSGKHVDQFLLATWICKCHLFYSGKPKQGTKYYEEHKDSPTIFVGAAHCNFICKDITNPEVKVPVETCCCLPPGVTGSCKESSFCPTLTDYVPAQPRDLQIICNRLSIEGGIPEDFTVDEKEFVFQVTKIAGHPQYQKATNDSDTAKNPKGPYTGFDISVYHVDDSDPDLALEERVLWPACLPRTNGSDSSNLDFFAGWNDPLPPYRLFEDDTRKETATAFIPRIVPVQNVTCADPAWMKSTTYYPSGTVCYKDPSEGSCFQFGNSGASVMTYFREDNRDAYAFTGPLSMHKGCDKVIFRIFLLHVKPLYKQLLIKPR